jgi:hypothetical protein
MAKQTCYSCVYAYWDKCQALIGLSFGFPSRPVCANQPDCPGQQRPVPPGGVCRNYRARPETPDLADGTVKRIPLTGGLFVYVDATDYEWLSPYTWSCHGGYAARHVKGKRIFMHREIMRPPQGMVVDHIDGNKLNNCRVNMRNCTPAENHRNRIKGIGASSRFRGVSLRKESGKYRAETRFHGAPVYLGIYDNEVEAARAYDRWAVEQGIEYARLNFPEEWPPARRRRVRAQWLKKVAGQKSRKPEAKGKRAGARVKPSAGRSSRRPGAKAKRTKRPNKGPRAPRGR